MNAPSGPKTLRDLTDDELTDRLGPARHNVHYSPNDYLTELSRRDTRQADEMDDAVK